MTAFKTRNILGNLQMGPTGQSCTLQKAKTALAKWAHLQAMKKMKWCEYSPLDSIKNTSFSLELTNVLNKLECYFTQG